MQFDPDMKMITLQMLLLNSRFQIRAHEHQSSSDPLQSAVFVIVRAFQERQIRRTRRRRHFAGWQQSTLSSESQSESLVHPSRSNALSGQLKLTSLLEY